MKKILSIIIMFVTMVSVSHNVFAKDNDVYVNSNEVEMEYNIYKKLCEIYSENYVNFMSEEMYNSIKNSDLDNVVISEYNDTPLLRSGYYTTNYKSLKMIKNGNHITLMLSWKNMPATRSYDVFGIRFGGTTKLSGNVIFMQTYKTSSTKTSTENYIQTFINGFGTSFLLPSDSITGLEESIDFNFVGTGTIFGTYQHAQRNVTLANSKNYSISASGLGNVINFASSVSSNYDAMSGVSLSV